MSLFGSLFGPTGGNYGSDWQTYSTFHLSALEQSRQRAFSQLAAARQADHDARVRAMLARFNTLTNAVEEPPKEPVKYAGIEIGEVEGWRGWHQNKGFLTSLVKTEKHWVPGEPMAGKPGDHDVMGVNAFKEARRVIDDYGQPPRDDKPIFIGRIALWGEIVEHEDGYRAEFGLPKSLEHVFPETQGNLYLLDKLRTKYCPASRRG